MWARELAEDAGSDGGGGGGGGEGRGWAEMEEAEAVAAEALWQPSVGAAGGIKSGPDAALAVANPAPCHY